MTSSVRSLGDYRLIKELGRGRLSIVYLAEGKGTRWALKRLYDPVMRDKKGIASLRLEANAIHRLRSRYIVQVDRYSVIEGKPCLLMEYVDGADLGRILERRRQLSVGSALRIAWSVAQALAHAHRAAIIHCDVKPGNIMVARRGTVKLTDFGIARDLSGALREITGESIAFTPSYVSPEQARGEKATEKSDIYSLGAVLYHMLAGKPPFEAELPTALLRMHIEDEPEPIETFRKKLPGALCTMVRAAMNKEPCRRPSAEELAEWIEGIASDQGVTLVRSQRSLLEAAKDWGAAVGQNLLSEALLYILVPALLTVALFVANVLKRVQPIKVVVMPTAIPISTIVPTVGTTPTHTVELTPDISSTPTGLPISPGLDISPQLLSELILELFYQVFFIVLLGLVSVSALWVYQSFTRLNINSASSEELLSLPGIGPVTAERIVRYREMGGPFKSIDDLKAVAGIGEHTFRILCDMIKVGPFARPSIGSLLNAYKALRRYL